MTNYEKAESAQLGKLIADKIVEIKTKYPELRVGQIIGNALPVNTNDPYYYPDKDLFQSLCTCLDMYNDGYNDV